MVEKAGTGPLPQQQVVLPVDRIGEGTANMHKEVDKPEINEDFHTPVASAIENWLGRIERFGFPGETLDAHIRDEINLDEEDDTWFEDGLVRIFDPYYDIDAGDIEKLESGKLNVAGFPVGQCTVVLKNGDELLGAFKDGLRQGRGSLEGDNLLKHGIIFISGIYKDSLLTGRGRAIISARSQWPMITSRMTFEGIFNEGYLEGPVRGLDDKGKLTFVGEFRKGLPFGCCWLAKEGQGWLYGSVDNRGRFSGDNVAFLFPDRTTAMVGNFQDEIMIQAAAGRVTGAKLNEAEVLCLELTTNQNKDDGQHFYSWSPSTCTEIKCDWLLPDCYEAVTVTCRSSKVNGAGEGTFILVEILWPTLTSCLLLFFFKF